MKLKGRGPDMGAVVASKTSGEILSFDCDDASLLSDTAALADSPLVQSADGQFEWHPADDEPLTRVSLACALYVWGATYDAIGRLYGVTRERIRQILMRSADIPIDEIKQRRRANLTRVDADKREATTTAIRNFLTDNGPSTAEAVAGATGVTAELAKQAWPTDLAHFQLAHLKRTTQQTWTDEQLLDALRAASLFEFPLTRLKYDNLLRVGQVDGPSGVRVMQRFGTWSAACDAAGVESGAARAAPYETRWTDDELLKFVSDYLRAPNYGGTFAGYDAWRKESGTDAAGSGTIRNRLGTWSEVKRRALETMWSNDE